MRDTDRHVDLWELFPFTPEDPHVDQHYALFNYKKITVVRQLRSKYVFL